MEYEKFDLMKIISLIYRKTNMYLNNEISELGITSGMAPFIMLTCVHGKMTQNDFCKYLDMNKGTVARAIAKLEENGFVERRCNSVDGRFIDVYPTKKAKSIYPFLKKIGEKWINEITYNMTENEKSEFKRLLEICAENSGKFFKRL